MANLKNEKSLHFYREAEKVFPGGVNSPVRAFGSVGGVPPFMERAKGPYLWDVDGNQYIDYVASWGPAILGHAHPEVVKAVQDAAERGLSFGAPTPAETILATLIQEAFPSLEMMRFVSSGTEACMSAIRVARAYTNRHKIVKFTGCYHGHADMLLVNAGSGVATLGIPGSPGVPEDTTRHTLVVPFNDRIGLESVFADHGHEIAAIIVEPIVGNGGFLRPAKNFLPALQNLCEHHGALLIFDEVMTGFRVAFGGVQELEQMTPDLTTLGKIVGGGMPLAVYGGRRRIMEQVAPRGSVYQAGTLSGNPVAVACGIKTLEILRAKNAAGEYQRLTQRTHKLVNCLSELGKRRRIPFYTDSEGGMFGYFFHGGPVTSFEQASSGDSARFRQFFWEMLKRGIYLAPSAFEAGFLSFAHGDKQVDDTLNAAASAFDVLT